MSGRDGLMNGGMLSYQPKSVFHLGCGSKYFQNTTFQNH